MNNDEIRDACKKVWEMFKRNEITADEQKMKMDLLRRKINPEPIVPEDPKVESVKDFFGGKIVNEGGGNE